MTIRIDLTPNQERTLAELAQRSGKDPAAYVQGVVAAYLSGVRKTGERTFEEVLAPIWAGWQASGMGEEEIEGLFERELREARQERRQRKGVP